MSRPTLDLRTDADREEERELQAIALELKKSRRRERTRAESNLEQQKARVGQRRRAGRTLAHVGRAAVLDAVVRAEHERGEP